MKLFRQLEPLEPAPQGAIYTPNWSETKFIGRPVEGSEVYLVPIPLNPDPDASAKEACAIFNGAEYWSRSTFGSKDTWRKAAAAAVTASIPQLVAENEALKKQVAEVKAKDGPIFITHLQNELSIKDGRIEELKTSLIKETHRSNGLVMENEAFQAALRAAETVHQEICITLGSKCHPSQLPEQVSGAIDRLKAKLGNAVTDVTLGKHRIAELETAMNEAEAGLEFAIATIQKEAPEVDWLGSSPRKALEIVKQTLNRKEGENMPMKEGRPISLTPPREAFDPPTGKHAHHELKTDPEPFEAVYTSRKTAELRKDDRNFKVGDTILLRETVYSYDEMQRLNKPLQYSGRTVEIVVTHKLSAWGIMDGYCILSFRRRRSKPPVTADGKTLGQVFMAGRNEYITNNASLTGSEFSDPAEPFKGGVKAGAAAVLAAFGKEAELAEAEHKLVALQSHFDAMERACVMTGNDLNKLKQQLAALQPKPELVPFSIERWNKGERDVVYAGGGKPDQIEVLENWPTSRKVRTLIKKGSEAIQMQHCDNGAYPVAGGAFSLLMPAEKPRVKELWLRVSLRPFSDEASHYATNAYESAQKIPDRENSTLVRIEIPAE